MDTNRSGKWRLIYLFAQAFALRPLVTGPLRAERNDLAPIFAGLIILAIVVGSFRQIATMPLLVLATALTVTTYLVTRASWDSEILWLVWLAIAAAILLLVGWNWLRRFQLPL